jgi:hypothetical protein
MKTMHIAAALVVLFTAGRAWAQIGAPVTPTGGVEVDGDGVLSSKTTSPDPRLADLRKNAGHFKKDEQLLYISLPRIFAEAKKAMDEGKPLPDSVRFLGGLTRIQYVFVYPEEKDLVIAGPAEPFDAADAFRPLGKITGRPVLQLDDLVIVLRACGPGRQGTVVGCDLQVTQEIADRIRAKTNELAPKVPQIGEKKAAELIAEAGGNQPVKYLGVDLNTRYAFVCIEADYRLKQLGLGILESPVKKVKSYNSMAGKPEQPHRFVLESNLQHLVVSTDGNAYELRGNSLKVNSGLQGVTGPDADKISDAAKKFVDLCNANLEDLCKSMVSWADLSNLADLAIVAALCAQNDLPKQLGWDLSWVMDPKGYRAATVSSPKHAKTLTTFRKNSAMTIFVSGGVAFDPVTAVKNRATDKVATPGMRPKDAWSVGVKPGMTPTEGEKK